MAKIGDIVEEIKSDHCEIEQHCQKIVNTRDKSTCEWWWN